jgi:transcriptional regulator with XRE-family HTH domain
MDERARPNPERGSEIGAAVADEGPPLQRQQLAAELRRIRLLAGMSSSDVARKTGLSSSNVSRFESGQVVPSPDQVDRWSHAVGASQLVREQLRVLTEAAATDVMVFRHHLLAPVPAATQEDVGRLEVAATVLRSCEPFLVPGLLQLPEYARQVMGVFGWPNAELDEAIAARVARQALMDDPARSFEFIVTEFGLRWSPTGTSRAVLSAQLSHIAEVAELPNVAVGVIRTGVPTRVALLQSFILYERVMVEDAADRIDLVLLETPAATIIVTDPLDVRSYRRHLAWLREAADFGSDAVSRIRGKKR